MHRSSALLSILAAAAAVVTLAGCHAPTGAPPTSSATSSPAPATPVADPAPSSAPTETAAPAPDPVAPPAPGHASKLVISSDTLTAYAADGSILQNWVYNDVPVDVANGLTTAFGFAPGISRYASGSETAAGTSYSWAGFTLLDPDTTSFAGLEFTVSTIAAAVGDVPVSTGWDLHVGSPEHDAEAVADWMSTSDGELWGALSSIDRPSEGPGATVYVGFRAPAGGVIDWIVSPARTFGD